MPYILIYDWVNYREENYRGSSVCMEPSAIGDGSEPCAGSPSFFFDASFLGGFAGSFSSAHKGCFSDTKVAGKATKAGEMVIVVERRK